MDSKIRNLQEENARQQKDIDENKESIKPLRKSQADTGADMIDIRDNLRSIRGMVDELKRDMELLKAERKERDAKLNDIAFRVNFLENFIGVNKKSEAAEGADRRDDKQKTSPARNGKADREVSYSSAYKSFKEGRYDEARKDFQKFLELFPKAEYSDNAQFWIGESYYVQGKYEKAILEYEKVIKNYPNSDKLPHALLKQGLSFQKLGDKDSAKLLLQQVVKDYPNTNQARIARAKLAEVN
ncbi:MAG: tol-pal system protein YbgF [Syntrophales bacterium]